MRALSLCFTIIAGISAAFSANAQESGSLAPGSVDELPLDYSRLEAESPRADLGAAWAERPFAVDLNLGIATPVGGVGVTFDAAPLRALSVGCGLGTNFVGLEVACMIRPRLLVSDERALTLGAGASGGPHTQDQITRLGVLAIPFGVFTGMGETPRPNSWHWDIAYFASFEAGYEVRKRTGATFRLFVGAAVLMNPDDKSPSEDLSAQDNYSALEIARVLGYGGVAFGRAF